MRVVPDYVKQMKGEVTNICKRLETLNLLMQFNAIDPSEECGCRLWLQKKKERVQNVRKYRFNVQKVGVLEF